MAKQAEFSLVINLYALAKIVLNQESILENLCNGYYLFACLYALKETGQLDSFSSWNTYNVFSSDSESVSWFETSLLSFQEQL
jgi:hypothetical protein